ncbi:MAG: YicC family protein [Cyclobacteriaceae bacterium]|nr:YicC family protein [Cyclobacteriaceae bacterium]
MTKSMTGYGVASLQDENYLINVEVKSLNSKFFDLQLKLPKALSDKEYEIRSMLAEILIRGKVLLNIDFARTADKEPSVVYNEELFVKYYQTLKGLADKVNDHGNDLIRLVVENPDVIISTPEKPLPDNDWQLIKNLTDQAIQDLDNFRIQEGEELAQKLLEYIAVIESELADIHLLEKDRSIRMREKLAKGIRLILQEEDIDKNRMEQEVIYYLEKLDITEELVRLNNHLKYFTEVIQHEFPNGKKLGFISQEIGREINTIGSKANDAPIQRKVVRMKEELEKIKEQTLNVL